MIENKIVVVAGGAGLLGKEFCKIIIKNNGIAVIADFDEISGNKAMREIKAETKSENVCFYKLDITLKEEINNLIKKLSKDFGKIDALVNNAYPRNKNYGRKLTDVEYADFCENVNLHLGGYFLMMQQFSEYFKKQRYGNIINISSIYGVSAPRFEIYNDSEMTMPVEYAAIKSAIIHLTKYFAKYYKGTNIKFNCISPGGILNNQNPSFIKQYNEFSLNKGMLDKSDISGTLLFLLSDMSKYINGQNIIVDDGFVL
ncbi:MAG: oxidoreductase [Bacteroidales bacterium]|jgi:NAD(P)-dependent dehydrogenase (short-subunit alcohol dehydrogenase family)